MKKLLILLTMLFSMTMFSSTSYAEWKKVTSNLDGADFYVDFETIKRNNGFLYYWGLDDYLEPLSDDDGPRFSSILMYKVDCDLLRFKRLTATFYSGQMGKGSSKVLGGDEDWQYTPPNSSGTFVRNKLCLSY